MSPNHFAAVRRKLLRWYDANHRDLPWRRTTDPYAIWISETMLQQTQVTTVVPYYERFLKHFPTVAALARSPLRRLLTLWSGLGYYRRAENIKKCADELVLNHRGQIPSDYGQLVSLPGIGPYTAGALMSIAFGRRYPALDGNARRVLGRICNAVNQTEIRAIASRLVPKKRPGHFNQAIMELGATLCIPKKPRCGDCPVALHCWATHHAPSQTAAHRSRALKNVTWPLAIVRHDGKLLVRQRSATGMLAGLWEFPGGAIGNKTVRAALRDHLGELNGAWRGIRPIGEVRHAITDKRIRAPVFLIELPPHAELCLANSDWRWIAPSSLRHYPVSSMTLKAARILAAHEKSFT
ncbi:MAG: A/G-specific adenine glycosylase [Alphaproteobacteria bacterium]